MVKTHRSFQECIDEIKCSVCQLDEHGQLTSCYKSEKNEKLNFLHKKQYIRKKLSFEAQKIFERVYIHRKKLHRKKHLLYQKNNGSVH